MLFLDAYLVLEGRDLTTEKITIPFEKSIETIEVAKADRLICQGGRPTFFGNSTVDQVGEKPAKTLDFNYTR